MGSVRRIEFQCLRCAYGDMANEISNPIRLRAKNMAKPVRIEHFSFVPKCVPRPPR